MNDTPALGIDAEEEEDELAGDEDDDAAAAASSAGVPTCSRPHRGVRVREGSACRSFWNRRAGLDWPPWRCRRDGTSSDCPGRRWSSPAAREVVKEEEVGVVAVSAADGTRSWASSMGWPGEG